MSNGFELIGKMPNIFALGKNNAGDETSSEDGAFQENTREKIKSYLKNKKQMRMMMRMIYWHL